MILDLNFHLLYSWISLNALLDPSKHRVSAKMINANQDYFLNMFAEDTKSQDFKCEISLSFQNL